MDGGKVDLVVTHKTIAYVVRVVSQFMHALLKPHLEVAHQILRYLKATLGKGVLFKKGKELKLEAYIDVD